MQKVSAHEHRIAKLLGKSHAQPLAEIQLEQAGLILAGHFRLRGNQHSSRYVKFSREFLDSPAGKMTTFLFLERLWVKWQTVLAAIDVVIGPESSGAVVAKQFADMLSDDPRRSGQVKAVRVTKDVSSGEYRLSKDDEYVLSGRQALVVDDVWNTGITLAGNVIPLLKLSGVKICGVAVLANRGNASLPTFYPFEDYWKVSDRDCYYPEDCPMCKAGEPITEF